MRVDLTNVAQKEILLTAQSYARLRLGIAELILFETEDKLAQIQLFPEGYQLVTPRLRRVELSIIPYQLYYSVVVDSVPILGFVAATIHPIRKHRIINYRLKEWHSSPTGS